MPRWLSPIVAPVRSTVAAVAIPVVDPIAPSVSRPTFAAMFAAALSLSLSMALSALFAPAAHAQLNFAPVQTYAVASLPYGFAVGDVNRDGKADIISANNTAGNVSILLNQGNGTFNPAYNVAVGAKPAAVAAVDVNGDGNLDLVVSNSGSNSVSVLLGTGNGGFLPPVNYGVGAMPNALAVTDLNGDGKPDIAVANLAANTVSVLWNLGGGTFNPIATTLSTGAGPLSLKVADVNRDGKPDIVVCEQSGATISVFLNSGYGAFQPRMIVSSGSHPYNITLADFSSDGIIDVASSDYNASFVNVQLGFGDGHFGPPAQNGTSALFPAAIESGDLNGDGRPDIVVSNTNTSGFDLGILLGNGDGTFQPAVPWAPNSTHKAIAVADLNGDGLDDLIAGNANGTVSVYLNLTASISSVTFDVPGAPPSIEAGHFSVVTVKLNTPAAPGGSVIHLGTQNAQIAYVPPAPIVVEEGKSSTTFIVGARTTGDTLISVELNGVVTSVPVHITPSGTTPNGKKGDVDGNGTVDLGDAITVLKIIGGIPVP